MITAYSYIRFSTVEQAKGNSLERQTAASQKYADENNLILDKSLTLKDLGISAFKGANSSHGALGLFLEAIKQGKVTKGSYLLVENLDRLSREQVFSALSQFMNILEKGIVIVTLSDHKKYDPDHIDSMDLMYSLSIMTRAHDESRVKSIRIKSAWDNKRANINLKKLTRWSPKWVYLSNDRTEFHLHQDRVNIVKNIFKWCESGLGNHLIIRKLEDLGIKPWGSLNENEPIRREPKRWYISYIQRILTDRTVLGEFKSSADKNVISPNYYPQIISEDLFYRVNHARELRNVRTIGKGAGRKGSYVSNLFSGLAYCGYSLNNNKGIHKCDGTDEKMVYSSKGQSLTYLQCAKVKSGTSGCKLCRKMWRYDAFETSFLTHIKDIDISTLIGTANELEMKISTAKDHKKSTLGKITALTASLQKLANALDEYDQLPKILITQMNQLESELEESGKELEHIKSVLISLSNEKKTSTILDNQLKETIHLMKISDTKDLFDIRLQLSDILKQAIHRIDLYSRGRIMDEKYFKAVKEKLGIAAVNTLIQANDNGKVIQPFYEVHYKSGISRLIFTDPKDPTKLNVLISTNAKDWLDATYSHDGELETIVSSI